MRRTVFIREFRLSTGIKLAIVLWLVAEVAAFVLVADLIGYPEALLLAFITSLFGWTLLKRAGASAVIKLRAALDGRRVVDGERHRFLDETLAALGALALLLPGFLSDAVGLVLAVPAARERLANWVASSRFDRFRFGGERATGRPSTIDLDPGEWQKTEPPPRSVPKPR